MKTDVRGAESILAKSGCPVKEASVIRLAV